VSSRTGRNANIPRPSAEETGANAQTRPVDATEWCADLADHRVDG